ncbi:AAA family ATPase [Mycolicibacterium celeriflavum]|uniref:Uncharacterized protein n=1 Tax=Mycolicibacterium celeriflavum TaxID=1249101 RepID=A0A1X0BKM7_MYCCF|nr:AAA family ATPase [Mycolicibacterium celeriflavum]MCV7236554.1 AAA family ATPase [Mycolicibacterium celeriflavum]ORA43053.1 hypothetical protein BST21_22510 [Mycolicibacterium celeriflavum]BBY41803.1 hypothetical protein MCEL_00980 [Mycolicibacterium celeriflavum]
MTYEFETMTFAQSMKLGEAENWVIENVIGATTTLLYGEAKCGKSFLVSALIKALATGDDFLGAPVPQDRAFSFAICWSDDMGAIEYRDRILTVMDDQPEAGFYRLPIMRTQQMWQALYERVMSDGHNFVVIDNLSQAVNGSVNNDDVMREFFDGVRLFVRAGIPVVVVAHSSDKFNANGHKSELPLGSSYISQAVRWRIFAKRSRKGNMTLKFMGNHAEPYELTLLHGAGARFDVIDRRVARSDETDKPKQQRTKSRLDAGAELLDWMSANCNGMTLREAAAKLAAGEGITENTAKQRINRAGIRKNGDGWALSPCTR